MPPCSVWSPCSAPACTRCHGIQQRRLRLWWRCHFHQRWHTTGVDNILLVLSQLGKIGRTAAARSCGVSVRARPSPSIRTRGAIAEASVAARRFSAGVLQYRTPRRQLRSSVAQIEHRHETLDHRVARFSIVRPGRVAHRLHALAYPESEPRSPTGDAIAARTSAIWFSVWSDASDSRRPRRTLGWSRSRSSATGPGAQDHPCDSGLVVFIGRKTPQRFGGIRAPGLMLQQLDKVLDATLLSHNDLFWMLPFARVAMAPAAALDSEGCRDDQ